MVPLDILAFCATPVPELVDDRVTWALKDLSTILQHQRGTSSTVLSWDLRTAQQNLSIPDQFDMPRVTEAISGEVNRDVLLRCEP